MRLSEAILLGVTIGKLNAGIWLVDGCGCAQGLAYMAVTGERKCEQEEIGATWPWVTRVMPESMRLRYRTEIGDMAARVQRGDMTIEALCDQVRAWEDELEAKGINVEQVSMVATPETTHEPAAEHTEKVSR